MKIQLTDDAPEKTTEVPAAGAPMMPGAVNACDRADADRLAAYVAQPIARAFMESDHVSPLRSEMEAIFGAGILERAMSPEFEGPNVTMGDVILAASALKGLSQHPALQAEAARWLPVEMQTIICKILLKAAVLEGAERGRALH